MMKINKLRKPRPSKVCQACKKRKVKCDQQRPACARCVKSSTLCSYEFSTDSLTPSSTTNSSNSPNTIKISNSNNNSSIYNYPSTINSINTDNHTNNKISPNGYSSSTNINDDYNNNTTTRDPSDDMILTLWHPRDTMVSYGTTTFVEPPFGVHTVVQGNPFSRAFAGALHGTALFELQDSVKLNDEGKLVPRDNESKENDTTNNNNTKTFEDKKNDISILVFLQNSIKTVMKMEKKSYENTPPMNFIYSSYDINSNVDPINIPIISTLLNEIEILLMDRETIDNLLKTFYQDIYPIFPLFEIGEFEKELKNVFDYSIPNRLRIQIGDTNVRKKLEVLTLFLTIITISLKYSYAQPENQIMNSEDSIKSAHQLSLFSHQLLYLLNVFKYTNELSLCCLLYFYISEYLNPESLKHHCNNETMLSIKCLYQLALTLGLYNEPNKYDRLVASNGISNSKLNFRKKLWLCLQMIILQTSLSEGDLSGNEHLFLNLFDENSRDSDDLFEDNNTPGFDSTLSQILIDQYKFHFTTVNLIRSLNFFNGNASLANIMEKVTEISDQLTHDFPLSKLQAAKPGGFLNNNETSWKGAVFNAHHLQSVTILRMNIIGQTTLLNVYQKLMFHFEELCKDDWIKYSGEYHTFFLKMIKSYCTLMTTLTDYLQGKYLPHIPCNYFFAMNKLICHTVTKLWLFQSCILVKISYKILHIKQKGSSVENGNYAPDDDVEMLDILTTFKSMITANMQKLTNLEKKIGDKYISISVASSLFKFVGYLAKNDILTNYTNRFWSNGFPNKSIPVSVQRKISLKWGLNIKYSHKVLDSLNNPISLACLDKPLITDSIKIMGEFNSEEDLLEDKSLLTDYKNMSQGLTEDLMNQFLENNLEWVSTVINEQLGEFPYSF